MPIIIVILSSIIIYGVLLYITVKKRSLLIVNWPINTDYKSFWFLFLLFLFLFSSFTFQPQDMYVWTEATFSLLEGSKLSTEYVYLPVYALVLSSLLSPFYFFNSISVLLVIYIIKLPVLLSYFFSIKLLVTLLPEQFRSIAPIPIALSPVTIFFIFFGTNHIVMLFLLLLTLYFMKKKHFFLAGVFSSLAIYKFLLIPTIIVLFFIVLFNFSKKSLWYFVLGGFVGLLPNLMYYIYDSQPIVRIVTRLGAVGGHAHHIEPFHFLYIFSGFPGVEYVYVQNKLWFFLILTGTCFSIVLYLIKRINALQALGISAAFVSLFSLEPFRLEPTIGLLWMDAVYRNDNTLKKVMYFVIFADALVWFPLASPRFLQFQEFPKIVLNSTGGFILGLVVLALIVVTVFHGNSKKEHLIRRKR